MSILLKKLTLNVLVLSMFVSPLFPALEANAQTSFDPSQLGTENEASNAVNLHTIRSGQTVINKLFDAADEISAYATPAELKINPKDLQYLKRWLEVAKAIKELEESDPEAYAAFLASDGKEFPEQIVKRFGLEKRPLANIDKHLLENLWLLLAPKELGGVGASYAEISRLTADYNTDKKLDSQEGNESKPEDFLEGTISSHGFKAVQAADVASFDEIYCTEITVDKEGKIKKRDKQKSIPIEFIWQAEDKSQNRLGGNRDGSLGPNGLGRMFGVSPDDLFSRFNRDNVLGGILDGLGEAGWSLRPENVLLDEAGAIGTKDPSDLFDLTGQALFRDVMGGSMDKNILRFGNDLPSTIDNMGAAIVSRSFPKLPIESIKGDSIDEWADHVGRITLGERLVDRGFRFEGSTGQELMENLGYQYVTGKILHLAPTSQLGELNRTGSDAIQASIGRIAASQRLGIGLEGLKNPNIREGTGYRFTNTFAANPSLVDHRLNLSPGTTQQLVDGALSADQYFTAVGHAVLAQTADPYADNGAVLMDAYGLSIDFGPEDIVLPDPAALPAREAQLAEIEQLYRSLITDADWQYFTENYRQTVNLSPVTGTAIDPANRAPLDEDSEIRTWLATHTKQEPDLITPALNGTATQETWAEIGMRLFAKLDPQPINQLAILRYLQTGTMMTLAIPGFEERAVVTDIDTIAVDKLGLLPGDMERLRNDRFATEILPRIAHDSFVAATERQPYDNGSIQGVPAAALASNEFIQNRLQSLQSSLKGLRGLSGADSALRNRLVGQLESAQASDWQATATTTNPQQLRAFLNSFGSDFSQLSRNLSRTQQQTLNRHIAELAAGRELSELTALPLPSIASARGLGLTQDKIAELFTGKISPDAFTRTLGTNYATRYLWDAADPEAMAADLTTLLKRQTGDLYQSFASKYAENFTDLAGLFNDSLGLQNTNLLSGTQFFELFAGNRLPLFDTFGKTLYESFTGATGTIFSGNPADLAGNIGIRNLMDAGGWFGGLGDLVNSPNAIQKRIFEQSLGISWGNNPTELLAQNGPGLLRALNAPSELVSQFTNIWDPNNPGQALAFLQNGDIWKNFDLGRVFNNGFGNDIGGGMANTFQGIFTRGLNPDQLLGSISNNLERFFPDFSDTFDFPVDSQAIFQAIKSGNTQALQGSLLGFGQSFLDQKVPGFSQILTNPNRSPEQMLTWATQSLPQMFGGSLDPAIAGMANTLTGYFTAGQGDPTQLLAAAGSFGTSLGIPYAGDAVKIMSDPRGFGLSFASAQMTSQLNSLLGTSVDYGTVRTALFGPDPAMFQAEAAAIRARISDDPELLATFSSLSEDSQNMLINNQLKPKMDKLRAEARENLTYSLIDGAGGLPAGFTKTMLKGTDEQRLDMMFVAADQLLGGLPPEARIALQLIKDKGDLTQIQNTAFAYLDGQLSSLVGVPLPPGFTQQTADLLSGKIGFDKYQDTMGNFAIGQVSGMLDGQLGLPVGTAYTMYQSFSQMADLSNSISQLQTDYISALGIGDDGALSAIQDKMSLDQAKLANLQGAMIGMAANMVFGEQLGQLEKSLGLPAGTTSLFLNAGLTSLLGGGTFMAALGAAFPMFAAGLVLGKFAGLGGMFGGILGGGGETKITTCTAAGYYPYIRPQDEKKAGRTDEEIADIVFDPNENLDNYEPNKRLKPEEVEEKLGIWPGYPGEFLGEKSDPKSFAQGKTEAARWKIREALGQLILMPQRTGNPRALPNQLIAYQIAPPSKTTGEEACKNSWDYMAFFDGRCTLDERLIKANADGEQIGVVDWSFHDGLGYGDERPGSGNALDPNSLQQVHYGSWNVGLWVEYAQEYLHHIHVGA